jgi:transposase
VAFPAQFRKKLLSVQEKEGLTNIEVATRFGVGKASISRWKVNPNPVFKRNRPAQKIEMEALKKDVEEHPDHFNYERADRFSVSESGIRNALKRLGVSRKKKTLKHPKADEVLREEFKIKIEKYKSEGREIVYVDESGFAHESTRSHGYAAVGERCFTKQLPAKAGRLVS